MSCQDPLKEGPESPKVLLSGQVASILLPGCPPRFPKWIFPSHTSRTPLPSLGPPVTPSGDTGVHHHPLSPGYWPKPQWPQHPLPGQLPCPPAHPWGGAGPREKTRKRLFLVAPQPVPSAMLRDIGPLKPTDTDWTTAPGLLTGLLRLRYSGCVTLHLGSVGCGHSWAGLKRVPGEGHEEAPSHPLPGPECPTGGAAQGLRLAPISAAAT